MEEARELLLKHLYLQGGDGLGISDGRVYKACLDAIMEALTLTDVVERFALIQWINGQPLIDGSDSFNTKEDALKHWQTLPKIDNVIYTVCRIRNVL